jgi:anti-anti-sigma factor
MEIAVDSKGEGVIKINVAGMVTLSGETNVEPLEKLLGDNPYAQNVILNLGEADKIDSSGIGWLVTCHKRLEEGGGQLILHSLQPMVTTVLKTVRLDKFLQVTLNERQAVELLKGEVT